MVKCHECNTTIREKQNKTKHEQSKKHKYFSNLVLNRYIVKDKAVDKFKDVISSYYNEHIKKIHTFSVVIYWDIDDEIKYKISTPNRISFAFDVYGYPTIINETACDFSNRIIKSCVSHKLSPNRIRETEIVLVSDLKDMTYSHYLEQPMSMIQRKMIRRCSEVNRDDINDFEYNSLPDCLFVDN